MNAERRAQLEHARRQESLLRQGGLWCDNHRLFPPRCQGGCGRTFVRLRLDGNPLTCVDPQTGPICARCAMPATDAQTRKLEMEGYDMARAHGTIDWQTPGVYGEQPLIEEAAALRAQGRAYSAIAQELGGRYGIEINAATVGTTLRRYERRDDEGEGRRGAWVVVEGNGDDGGGAAEAPPLRDGNGAPPPCPLPLATTDDVVAGGRGGEVTADGNGNGNGEGRGTAGARSEDGNGNGNGDGACRIDVELPGIELHVRGESLEELLERVGAAERLIGGVLP